MRRRPASVAAAFAAGALAASCTLVEPSSADDAADGLRFVTTDAPDADSSDAVSVLAAASAAEAALSVSGALYAEAPVVVVAAGDDPAAMLRGASSAVALGAPLLPAADGNDLTPELERLGTDAVLTVGPVELDAGVDVVNAPADDERLAELLGVQWTDGDGEAGTGTAAVAGLDREKPLLLAAAAESDDTDPPGDDALPATSPADPRDDVVVLSTGADADLAAVATARAAGASVRVVPSGDPRTSEQDVEAISGGDWSTVLALGAAFGDHPLFAARVAVARTGTQLPGGGQTLFPGRRLVALYGHPGTPSLGVLGEQPVEQAIQRAKDVTAPYQELSDRPVVPTFEIIATVASSTAGGDGNWSNEVPPADLRPWVDAARDAGVYVLLDLQPGTTDFLTQAKLYEELLLEPHVGLALDPEWRLAPGQRHMAQIGSVSAAEVNEVSQWLAELTRQHSLPQKLLVLHQFKLAMITDRASLVTSHDEVALLVHADGHGTPGEKVATWNAVRAGASAELAWGWKNFYDEDRPTFTPEQTYQQQPVPDLVTYQ